MNIPLFNKKQKRLGLSLRGGGARAHAYLGLIKLLEELEIPIHAIIGSSGGAIMGGAYAAGVSIENILKHGYEMESFNFFDFENIANLALWDNKKAVAYTRKLIGTIDFNKTKTLFTAQVTNADNYSYERINSGELAIAIAASSAFSGLLSPVDINGKSYIDGDYSSTFDTQYLRDQDCDVVIGLRTGEVKHNRLNIPLFFSAEMRKVMRNLQDEGLKHEPVDLLIDNMAEHDGEILDFTRAYDHFEKGYEIASSYRDTILELMGKQ